MQKKLLNFSLLSIGFIFTIYSCIRAKDSHSKGLSDLDKKYLIKIERQFRNDSLSKIEYFVKKSDFLCQRREYKLAFNFCQGLDSLDIGYFKYPIEKKIMLNNLHILEYNKEGRIKERDSVGYYINNFINKEKYRSRQAKATQEHVDYENYLSRMQWNVRNMLLYEHLDMDEKGNIK